MKKRKHSKTKQRDVISYTKTVFPLDFFDSITEEKKSVNKPREETTSQSYNLSPWPVFVLVLKQCSLFQKEADKRHATPN